MRLVGVVLAVLATFGPRALADFTFPLTALVVGHDPLTLTLDNTLVPAGDYAGYRVRTNWSPASGSPWSSEARWQLLEPSLPVPLAESGAADTAADDSGAVLLRWVGSFVTTYTGASPLTMRAWQTLPSASAAWDNLSITLLSGSVPEPAAPAATDWGLLESGGRVVETLLQPREVLWYRFETPAVRAAAGEFLHLDTRGSQLAGGEFGDGNDTELALYDARGLRVAFNDDLDQDAGDLLSGLTFGLGPRGGQASAGDLAAGEYFLAVSGFDTVFGDAAFEAISTSPVHGMVQVNAATNVPEPSSALLVGTILVLPAIGRRARARS